MGLVYNVFGKDKGREKRIPEGEIITYILSKEEIEERYGNIKPKMELRRVSSIGYTRTIKRKLRKMCSSKDRWKKDGYYDVIVKRTHS